MFGHNKDTVEHLLNVHPEGTARMSGFDLSRMIESAKNEEERETAQKLEEKRRKEEKKQRKSHDANTLLGLFSEGRGIKKRSYTRRTRHTKRYNKNNRKKGLIARKTAKKSKKSKSKSKRVKK